MQYVEGFLLTLTTLTLLGVQLQTLGSKTNTLLRIIDLSMNFLVIGTFLVIGFQHSTRGGKMSRKPTTPLEVLPPTCLKVILGICSKFLLGIWFWKCVLNVYPLMEMFYRHFVDSGNPRFVSEICDRNKTWFAVPDLKAETPSVFICNHGMHSLDDVVAIGALTDDRTSVLINGNPSGLSLIPANCRERMCVLPPGADRYERTKEILREEILERGKSMIVFPEDMKRKSSVHSLAPLRRGVINICWELGIPVIPLWFEWPTPFPSVFRDTGKKLLGKRTSKSLDPKNFSNSEDFHREITIKLEKLGLVNPSC
jgi:hypothetical protein